MPKGLKRYYGRGHLHFLTFSCYRRLPLLLDEQGEHVNHKRVYRVYREAGLLIRRKAR